MTPPGIELLAAPAGALAAGTGARRPFLWSCRPRARLSRSSTSCLVSRPPSSFSARLVVLQEWLHWRQHSMAAFVRWRPVGRFAKSTVEDAANIQLGHFLRAEACDELTEQLCKPRSRSNSVAERSSEHQCGSQVLRRQCMSDCRLRRFFGSGVSRYISAPSCTSLWRVPLQKQRFRMVGVGAQPPQALSPNRQYIPRFHERAFLIHREVRRSGQHVRL